MKKNTCRAGQNIRELALKRRINACICFVMAGLSLYFPFRLTQVFDTFLQQISASGVSANGGFPPQSAIAPPAVLYLVFSVISLKLTATGLSLWKRAHYADQGAEGEEKISQVLLPLVQEGWQFEYGMRLSNGLGDADVVCLSPRHKAYVIDVKSHGGEITTDGGRLLRRTGKRPYPFKKDFLEQSLKQAFQVKKQKGLDFVTPIVAFSEARVSLPPGKLRHVYVVEKSRLPILLRRLG